MIDYKKCTTQVVREEESWLETVTAGIGFVACLIAIFIVLSLIDGGLN